MSGGKSLFASRESDLDAWITCTTSKRDQLSCMLQFLHLNQSASKCDIASGRLTITFHRQKDCLTEESQSIVRTPLHTSKEVYSNKEEESERQNQGGDRVATKPYTHATKEQLTLHST
jgi:hypothetical protein